MIRSMLDAVLASCLIGKARRKVVKDRYKDVGTFEQRLTIIGSAFSDVGAEFAPLVGNGDDCLSEFDVDSLCILNNWYHKHMGHRDFTWDAWDVDIFEHHAWVWNRDPPVASPLVVCMTDLPALMPKRSQVATGRPKNSHEYSTV